LTRLSAILRYTSLVAGLALAIPLEPYRSIGQQRLDSFEIDNQYVTGLQSPTAMAFAPDGRLFITEQAGVVRIVSAEGQLLPTPFLTLPSFRSDEERGLLGLAFDPDFASNGYVYIFYTPDNTSRLSRVTANGNVVVANSEVVLLEYYNYSGNHRGGDIHFGSDGKLYLGLGDAGNPGESQSATSLNGKMLRLNKDGTIPADNPSAFTSTDGTTLTPAGQYKAIWAMGLRNPYRFAFDLTGKMHINDVGQGSWEEVNVGAAGTNYGWPTCEGLCGNPYAQDPIYVHQRGTEGCAITGGTFYNSSHFPAEYHDNYFLIDYCSTWIRRLLPDNTLATFPISIPEFSVDLKVGPDGNLYVLGYGAGSISRITHLDDGTNGSPVAVIEADPTNGAAPLTVNFDGSRSTDPDGDTLSFAWDFGDGATATGATVAHTYSSSGRYTAELTVADGRGGIDTEQSVIAVGEPPVATLTAPPPGSQYSAGDTIAFAGDATDPDDGPLPPSAFSWTVMFHHDSHTHPVLGPLTGVKSGSFVVPTSGHTEDSVFYRVYLTVTDSTGLQTQVTGDVVPRKVRLTLTASKPGAQMLLDGQPHMTPYTFVSIVGLERTIEVPDRQFLGGTQFNFVTWSNGGPRSQTIVTPSEDTAYHATIQEVVSPVPDGEQGSTGGAGTAPR
jgi:glucose/arabinose dehydrogenase/PKD repeat protein